MNKRIALLAIACIHICYAPTVTVINNSSHTYAWGEKKCKPGKRITILVSSQDKAILTSTNAQISPIEITYSAIHRNIITDDPGFTVTNTPLLTASYYLVSDIEEGNLKGSSTTSSYPSTLTITDKEIMWSK